MSGYPAESGTARERPTGDAERGADCAVRSIESCGGDGICIPINDKATRYSGGGTTRNHDGSGNGLGVGRDGDPAPTITAGDRHIVAEIKGGQTGAILDITHACDVVRECGDVAPTLQSRMGTGGNQAPCWVTYGIGNGQANEAAITQKEVSQTLNTMHDAQAIMQCYGSKSKMEFGAVRRLTPTECERLQGFPDGWTDIGEWRDCSGKLHSPSDSPRYKALGNSIALPFWDFLAKRISAQYLRPITLGSLFDGIGGFPLVFERHNGAGTCLWASEIEPFCIAVTTKRFPNTKESKNDNDT